MKNKTTIFSSKCMYYSTFRQSSHVAYRATHQKLVESHGLLMATYVETMKRPRTEDLVSLPDPQDVLAPHTLHTIQGSATPVYSRSDYPNVRYWYKEAWRQVESKRKDSSNLGSNASIRGGTRCAQGENVSTTYIEESDGTPIPGLRAAEIREFARSIWKGLYSRGLAPPKWRDATLRVQDEYTAEMERRWPVLGYCENHWKVRYLATKNYPQWYGKYEEKMKKAKNNQTDEPPLKKPKNMIEDDDTGNCQSDVETDAAPEVSDRDINLASSSQLEDNIREVPRIGTSRPRARPLKDPL